MKSTLQILAIICLLGFLAGCGVKEQQHNEVIIQLSAAKKELSQINSELEQVLQEQADVESDVESKIAAHKKQIAALQSQETDLRKKGKELDDRIEDEQNQEGYVFQSAGVLLDAQDSQGALQAYQNFVAKFPQGWRGEKAKKIIASLAVKLGADNH